MSPDFVVDKAMSPDFVVDKAMSPDFVVDEAMSPIALETPLQSAAIHIKPAFNQHAGTK
jgi:hypothetical protein